MDTKTKIVATMGPASWGMDTLRELILTGVNVCRLNFSHGSYSEHEQTINNIRKINHNLQVNTAILADLQGPKLRIGEVENNGVEIINGNKIIFSTEECLGTAEKVYMTYPQFPQDVQEGEMILVDDGKIHLRVVSTDGEKEVVAEVVHGGILKSKKGVNLPNTRISLPCLTEKDLKDLDFALSHDVEWIGLSFVRSAQDILDLKKIIEEKGRSAKVVAKIEKPEAVEDIDKIIQYTDAIMVARGDLGVEVPMQDVPLLQKNIIKKCRRYARPIIVATQMMESMIDAITPTRAEVNDVANAVMDGADAVMLSGETSVGKYPVKVIETIKKILVRVEEYEGLYEDNHEPVHHPDRFITDSICETACNMANRAGVKSIMAMTHSGYTAFKLSSHRPKSPIYVFTSNHRILNMVSLIWGVRGFYYDKFVSTDHTIADLKFILKNQNCVKEGDLVINIASMPIVEKGMTNTMKMSKI